MIWVNAGLWRQILDMAYESLATGQQVSYVKMIDAATGYQKVKRLES